MASRFEWKNAKNPKKTVTFGVVVMLAGVALYVFQNDILHEHSTTDNAIILLLIGLGFGFFTAGALRYLKALEAEAKAEIERAEQEKAYDELTERTENEKKREELDAMLSAGLISRDEYDCAMKKYKE